MDIDGDDLDRLERELPHLMRVRRFADSLDRAPWLANLGEPPSPAVRAVSQAYCDGLGFPEAGLAILVDWEDAVAAAESQDYNAPAWEAEELLRADLTAKALDLISEDAFTIMMELIASRASASVSSSSEESAALWDSADNAARRAIEGAVLAACHGAALVLATGEAEEEELLERHPFALKYQLFEFGRWPVGIAGATFNLF